MISGGCEFDYSVNTAAACVYLAKWIFISIGGG